MPQSRLQRTSAASSSATCCSYIGTCRTRLSRMHCTLKGRIRSHCCRYRREFPAAKRISARRRQVVLRIDRLWSQSLLGIRCRPAASSGRRSFPQAHHRRSIVSANRQCLKRIRLIRHRMQSHRPTRPLRRASIQRYLRARCIRRLHLHYTIRLRRFPEQYPWSEQHRCMTMHNRPAVRMT